MNSLLQSLAVGAGVGALAATAVYFLKMGKNFMVATFLHYLFLAALILHCTISIKEVPWWLYGGIISLPMALPLTCAAPRRNAAMLVIIAVAAGILISVAGHIFKINSGISIRF